MKNKDIIEYTVRGEMPDREQIKENILQTIPEKQVKKRPIYRYSIATVATAALLIVCVMFGNMFLTPQGNNIFALKAYAMEQQDDGSVELCEVNLQTQPLGFYADGENIYLNIGLKYEGENIKSVEFITDDGFFAMQYLKMDNRKIIIDEGITKLYVGDSHTIVLYGVDFEIAGNRLILDDNEMTDDLLLFLGLEISNQNQLPSQITIRAVATFTNGKTQEETLILDLYRGDGVGIIKHTPEEMERIITETEKRQALLNSIPLDKCEIIEDTIQTFTCGDTFVYGHNKYADIENYFPITEEAINLAIEQGLFDESGIFRQGSNLPDDGSDGFIAVIIDNKDGTFTGMVYKVPGQLILENME